MGRIKLTIMYDGTDYCGFQKQKNRKSIQETLEKSIFDAFLEEVTVYGSGRTDKGVHANGQVVHFDLKSVVPANKVFRVLNTKLPKDIRAISSEEVLYNFNARYDVKEKTYRYQMYLGDVENPNFERYALLVKKDIDIKKMREGAKYLLGKHDFVALSSTGSSVRSTKREIYSAEFYPAEDFLVFEIVGSGFLYNMVRIIVGTLIDIGEGKKDVTALKVAIEEKDRKKAGITAPSKGLFLQNVGY